MNKKIVSVVIPAYNEAENIPVVFEAVRKVLSEHPYDWEIIFVNDGSSDSSEEVLLRMAEEHPEHLRYLFLSKNFGHQLAVKAGLDYSEGNAVISMDCDMQHPPELISEMLKKWEEGNRVVATVREYPQDIARKKKKSSDIFYKILNLISDVEIKNGTADFRLLDRRVVNILREMNEPDPFLRGIIPWVGFRQIYIPYTAGTRHSGETKYTLKKMASLAISGATSFSVKPLYFSVYLGFLFSFLSILYVPYVVYSFMNGSEISGWASLIMTVVFFGGLQLSILGIIGIYIGKIFKQTKNRPNYIVKNSNF